MTVVLDPSSTELDEKIEEANVLGAKAFKLRVVSYGNSLFQNLFRYQSWLAISKYLGRLQGQLDHRF
jgi:hypothetical protein